MFYLRANFLVEVLFVTKLVEALFAISWLLFFSFVVVTAFVLLLFGVALYVRRIILDLIWVRLVFLITLFVMFL
jgi:hypothetical protein